MSENKTYTDPEFSRRLKKEANRAKGKLYQAAEQYAVSRWTGQSAGRTGYKAN